MIVKRDAIKADTLQLTVATCESKLNLWVETSHTLWFTYLLVYECMCARELVKYIWKLVFNVVKRFYNEHSFYSYYILHTVRLGVCVYFVNLNRDFITRTSKRLCDPSENVIYLLMIILMPLRNFS